MLLAAEMSEIAEWRERIEELRQVAACTRDPERRRRLLDLADSWEKFASDLDHGAAAVEVAR
jgi:hypothetical protein